MFLILHYPMIFFCKSKVLFRHFRGIPIIVWIVDRSLGFSLVSDFVHNVESRSKVCSSFTTIDKMNNIARYNLIDTKYRQMEFRSARWRCSRALFGNTWSNKSEWWLPEGENPWNLLFSIRIQAQTKSNQGSKPWNLMDVPIVEWQRHCSRVTTIRHHPVFPFGGSIVECGSLKLSRLNLTESEGENSTIVEFQALKVR